MSRSRLKLVMVCWAFLVIATIWVDRWSMSLVSGQVMCVVGVLVLTATAAATGAERKESRRFGLLLLLVGASLSLLQAIDRFVIRYH